MKWKTWRRVVQNHLQKWPKYQSLAVHKVVHLFQELNIKSSEEKLARFRKKHTADKSHETY